MPSDLFRGSKDGRAHQPWFDKLTMGLEQLNKGC
jgi:hypothetical protein